MGRGARQGFALPRHVHRGGGGGGGASSYVLCATTGRGCRKRHHVSGMPGEGTEYVAEPPTAPLSMFVATTVHAQRLFHPIRPV